MGLIDEYFELSKKYMLEYGSKTVLLMQVGAFYEVYGVYNKLLEQPDASYSRIQDFGQLCELNMVEKTNCTSTSYTTSSTHIVMAGFKDIMIERYIDKLQNEGYTAVVYNQDTETNTKAITRSLAGIFSPGTYVPLEYQRLSNYLVCFSLQIIQKTIRYSGKMLLVGMACIDVYTGKTFLTEYDEKFDNKHNLNMYDKLEQFISIYHPSELVCLHTFSNSSSCSIIDDAYVQEIVNHIGIRKNSACLIHYPKKEQVVNCTKQTYQQETLQTFYDSFEQERCQELIYEHPIATSSFCYLLHFVYLHNPNLVRKLAFPVIDTSSNTMLLANHSLQQLNILSTTNDEGICDMLNQCATFMGKRQFNYDFTHPICDVNELEKKYSIMEHILSQYHVWEDFQFRQKMHQIKDWSKISRQIVLCKITPKTFFGLFQNIKVIQSIFQWHDRVLIQHLEEICPSLGRIEECCAELIHHLESHVNMELISNIDAISNFGETNFLRKGMYPVLDEQYELLTTSEATLASIANCFSQLIAMKEKNTRKPASKTVDKTVDYVKINETEKNNYSLICTSRRCKLLEEVLPVQERCLTLNGQPFKISKTQFTFPKQTAANCCIVDEQIQTLCRNISDAKANFKTMITKYYLEFVTNFEEFQPMIETIIQYVVTIDILYTKCMLAKKYNYCKPVIQKNDSLTSFVSVKHMRHCLIERLEKELYVTNDLDLGTIEDKNLGLDTVNGVLLFGTNRVGKTSFIKALGICVIMAQAGLYVPCSAFAFYPFRSIFTRILGNDDIFKGLSTFEVEMLELRTILTRMDPYSLILGDELCSGTETMSAIAIFVSSLQEMHKAQTNFIFATHLHEIVNFEEIARLKRLRMKHMAVIYNAEQGKMIYDRKLKDGSGSNCYGLEVCKSLMLPPAFLENAFQIRMKYTPQVAPLLDLKPSRYNSKKIVHLCEKCKSMGAEVHHIFPQKDADANGFITNERHTFHKNHKANLMTLCEKCHQAIHNVKHEVIG